MGTEFTPQAWFGLLFDYVKTGLVKAAVDLELFTHMAHGHRTGVSAAAQADERAVRIALNAKEPICP
jgi:hypothetical protein